MIRLMSLVIVFSLGVFPGHIASAQQPASVQRVGFLGPPGILLDVLRKALTDFGYVEGKNVLIESRWSEGDRLDLVPEAAAALVSLKPDVIVAVGATAARAAKGATTSIPIVFEVVLDPVAAGLVANRERPDGNATGFTSFDPQHARKQLEILREVIPGLSRVALLGDASASPALFQVIEDLARALGLQTQTLNVARVPNPDFDGAFEAARKEGAGAIVVLSTPVTSPNRKRIAELAARHRLPIMSPRDHADAGGLICYGTSFSEGTRRSAGYVDKILKGAKPGDLPVETVSKHELIINLKTARELGVTIPAAILSSANQVIQ